MKIPKYILGLSALGTAVGAYVLLKDESGGPKYEGNEKILGKTVIVTGATSGIGKETAMQLASRGGRIIMACRDMDKCARVSQEIIDATSNEKIYCRKLDLSSIQSIREFADNYNKSEERLDVLINNAGVLRKNRSVTQDGFEGNMGVNFLGKFLLTNLLLDKMKSTSGVSRIINLVCVGYRDARIEFEDFNLDRNYFTKRANKMASYANILFTDQLAKKMKGSSVNVFAVNPGLAETDLRREFGTHNSFISKYLLRPLFVTLFKTPKQASQTVIFAALHPSLDLPEFSGKLFSYCEEEKLNEMLLDESISKRLWSVAEVWTQLRSINSLDLKAKPNTVE